MAFEHCALQTGKDLPLAEFSIFLQAQGLQHELVQNPAGWAVWVAGARVVPVARRLYAAYAQSRGLPALADDRTPAMRDWLHALPKTPLTYLLLMASLAVSVWTGFGQEIDSLRLLTIVDFEVQGSQVLFPGLHWLAQEGEWWRLLSPVLLHFNVSHLVFNSLWIWVLGRHLERAAGALRLLLLVSALGIVANIAQFLETGPLFGGLSGVAFGLLAYCLIMQGHRRYSGFRLSTAMWIFAIVYISIGFTPFTSALGLGQMANAAHLSGLIGGAFLGAVHRALLHALD